MEPSKSASEKPSGGGTEVDVDDEVDEDLDDYYREDKSAHI